MRQTRHPDHYADGAIPVFNKTIKQLTCLWYVYNSIHETILPN